MAESVVSNLASNILSTISAYERDRSMGDARDELSELTRSIETIQAVLLDAERKQESSHVVKCWLNRLRDVLYDVDDLFDGVVTDEMLEKHNMKGINKSLKKVSVYIQKFNPIVSSDFVKKVKATKKILNEISSDLNAFGIVRSQPEEPIRGFERRHHTGSFVNSERVIGREEDKKAILEMLLNEADTDVIAIVGMGAIGKTTLAQLIYNDKDVIKNFGKRWFACISDTSDDEEIIGRIYESIGEINYSDFTVSQLQTKIRESIENEKFMLVLDDVWDDNHARWQHRMNLFSNSSKGSKIVVTTRSLSVAKAVGALKTHNLGGLSEEESWDLFKRVAFISEQQNDPRWIDIGREIVKKCANFPLCILCIGSILRGKSIQEWESIKNQELSKLEEPSGNPTMNMLKLSYDRLPSNLKHCFAYCSLFPKDFRYDVKKLVYLWIGQGYIKKKNNDKEQTVEQVGHSYFMYLFQRCFFQEAEEWHGVIYSCKMHPLLHDLAEYVAGEEMSTLSTRPYHFHKRARHVAAIGDAKDSSWEELTLSLDINRVRSLVIDTDDSGFPMPLYQRCTQVKTLRTLILRALGIEIVPSSIGELKHLRYLDLSGNKFVSLPDSMTNLWNLLVLDLKGCTRLKALPENFRNLMNLRDLSIWECSQLKHMPPAIGEMTSLQYLDAFKIGKKTINGTDGLEKLNVRGILGIEFEDDIDDWNGDGMFQLPATLQGVSIEKYPGTSIPRWADRSSSPPNLVMIYLSSCKKLIDLPPFRGLPYVKSLWLEGLEELEYVDNDNDEYEERHSIAIARAEGSTNAAPRFFPRLEILKLANMPKLKGWKKEVHIEADSEEEKQPPRLFPSLSQLMIHNCPELKSTPQCPLKLFNMAAEETQQFLSTPPRLPITSSSDVAFAPLRHLEILNCHNLRILHLSHLTYPVLRTILIRQCDGLISLQVESLPALMSLHIKQCNQLKSLHIARLNALKRLTICSACPELELWEEDEEKRCHLDWDSLPNLSQLTVDRPPPTEKLPNCLQHRQSRGNLHIFSPMTDPSRPSTSREEEPQNIDSQS